jgi:hypothetical protein
MFLVDTFAGLTSPIASKQCQLIIDFSTKPLAHHSDAVTIPWVCARRDRQKAQEPSAHCAPVRSAGKLCYRGLGT